MYIVENQKNGFQSIADSIYWAVVTLTTVGYGDVVPVSALGKTISVLIMLLGYAIIAVPTGIVSAEFAKNDLEQLKNQDEQLKNQDEIMQKENQILLKENQILDKLKALEQKIDKLEKKLKVPIFLTFDLTSSNTTFVSFFVFVTLCFFLDKKFKLSLLSSCILLDEVLNILNPLNILKPK